jgi:photosystem II stability/assembly factor-like uncharacterized protein
MKNLILSFFFLSGLYFPCLAQWVWKNQLPQGNNLNAVTFTDQFTGYAVGEVGTMMKTSDGGATWTIQNLIKRNKFTNLVDICFPTPSTGFAIDSYGKVFRSLDGGVSWDSIFFEVGEGLFALSFPDELHGWIACSGGLVLRTSDGGDSWDSTMIVPVTDWLDIEMTGTSTGLLCGYYGIMKTSDGGLNWSQVVPTSNYPITCLSFIDSQTGFAGSRRGQILKTTDGGASWTSTFIADSVWVRNLIAVDRDTLFICGLTDSAFFRLHRVYRSFDGGNHWTKLPTMQTFNYPNGIWASATGKVFTVGEGGCLAYSNDCGDSWILNSRNLTMNDIRDIDFPSDQTAYIACRGYENVRSILLKTSDGGEHWEVADSAGMFKSFNAVRFLNENYGIVGGSNLWYTFDGAQTLQESNITGLPGDILSIDYAGSCPIAVGVNGIVLRSPNMGQNWTFVDLGTTTDFRSVCFPSSQTGFIGGVAGLYKSNDGGLTWAKIYASMPFGHLCFLDTLKGFMVSGNALYQTLNGGFSWSAVTLPGNSEYYFDINFYDQDTGFMVGTQSYLSGGIMKTTDGGQHWMIQTLPVISTLNTVCVSPSYISLTGGTEGKLFLTNNGGTTGTDKKARFTEEMAVEIFPNPASGQFKIGYILSNAGDTRFELFNLEGKMVSRITARKQRSGKNTLEQDVSGLRSGLYFYRLHSGNQSSAGKIIIR